MQGAASRPLALAPREWVLAGLLVLGFAPALIGLAGVWRAVEYQSHGFLVPVVSAYVAMRERRRLARLPACEDARGLWLIGVALVAYLVGLATGLLPLQGLALVVAVAGAVLYARGPAWLRGLAFPIGFLIFMVPPPTSWITPLIVALQGLVARCAVFLLGGFGLSLAREGNVLRLPGGEALFVAEACSGVTSVVTLTPLAVLLGYLTLRRLPMRLLLVLLVIPLAFAGNLARVAMTCWIAERWGVDVATTGPPHDLAGLVTYGVACGLMLVVGALLRRFEAGHRWNSPSG